MIEHKFKSEHELVNHLITTNWYIIGLLDRSFMDWESLDDLVYYTLTGYWDGEEEESILVNFNDSADDDRLLMLAYYNRQKFAIRYEGEQSSVVSLIDLRSFTDTFSPLKIEILDEIEENCSVVDTSQGKVIFSIETIGL